LKIDIPVLKSEIIYLLFGQLYDYQHSIVLIWFARRLAGSSLIISYFTDTGENSSESKQMNIKASASW
jgi:hypothetical protein